MADNEATGASGAPEGERREPEGPGQGAGKRRRGHRRRRGGRRADPLSPVTRPRRLNLDLPVDEPLGPDEQREMSEHLAFIRQFKPFLGLSLNAAEDLLVNGARPPTDRGVCKHLLSKLDRRAIDRALGREAIKSEPSLRARLLAGAVRISPDVSTLLAYLEALTWVAEKHEAAAAFGATIDRIDFGTVSATSMGAVLDVINKTFAGHERVQAFFGLLENDSFRDALHRTLDVVPAPTREQFAPLAAARNAVLLGTRPRNDEERQRIEQGVGIWLEAPERILRGYPLHVRRRLIEYALSDDRMTTLPKAVRVLADSLPKGEEGTVAVSLALYDRLLAVRQEDAARGLLNVILQGHPDHAGAKRRQQILSWPRAGRLALDPSAPKGGRIRRAFWFDLPGFVWARMGESPRDADRLSAEAELQRQLNLPGVAGCLGEGSGQDATPFVAIEPGGRVVETHWTEKLPLAEALALCAQAVRILSALADRGVDLPDSALGRFVTDRGPSSLRLVDFDGATARRGSESTARPADVAARFCRDVLGRPGQGLREDVPSEVGALLSRRAAADRLAAALARHAARAWDDRNG